MGMSKFFNGLSKMERTVSSSLNLNFGMSFKKTSLLARIPRSILLDSRNDAVKSLFAG